MKISSLFLFIVAFVPSVSAFADPATADTSSKADIKAVRQLLCSAGGGKDITDSGTLSIGEDVRAVAVCLYPGRSVSRASDTLPRENAAFGPLPTTPVTASLHPPSGNYSLSNGNPFTTSCSVDLHIAPWAGLPAVSNGTSTFNCRGYNVGNSSVGCNVKWSGPTSVNVGQAPYGGSAAVNFSCAATYQGATSTVMDYSYRDSVYVRINYSVQGVFGVVNVSP